MEAKRTPSVGAAPKVLDSEKELVCALESDPLGALGPLFDCYGGLIYGLALAVLGSRQDAEDLTQEVFLALLERWRYDPDRGSLAALLVTMTRSRALDQLRARSRRTRGMERLGIEPRPVHQGSALEELLLSERAERVRAALATLPEGERQSLELAYFQGLSQPQVAEAMQTPLGTVKSWMRRGALRLRVALVDLTG